MINHRHGFIQLRSRDIYPENVSSVDQLDTLTDTACNEWDLPSIRRCGAFFDQRIHDP